MKHAFAAIVMLALVACTAAPAPAPDAASSPTPGSCAAGGVITKVCRRQVERCVTPFVDGGKVCTDGSQCTGDCLFDGPEPTPGEALVGRCQMDDNPCGCFMPLVKGKLSDQGKCVD